MADPVSIAAGTIVTYKQVGASTTAVELKEVKQFGAIQQRSPEINATPLNASAVRYIAGLKDGQAMEIQCYLLTDDSSQNGLKGHYDARHTVEITVKPPDTSSQIRFNYTLTGHDVDLGNVDQPKMRMFQGRLSSDPIYEANTNPSYTAGP